jgi:hypothetical protein
MLRRWLPLLTLAAAMSAFACRARPPDQRSAPPAASTTSIEPRGAAGEGVEGGSGRPETSEAAHVAADDHTRAIREARRKVAGGDEAGAIAALDAVIAVLPEGSPERTSASCELATIFNNRAERIFRKDPRLGEADMRRARELCPGAERIAQNLAAVLFARALEEDRASAAGRTRAIAFLNEAVELDGTRVEALLVIADLKLQENEPTVGLELLQRARALAPDDARVAARLGAAEKTARVELGFRDTRHNHFVARFEGYAQERIAWQALDLLEQAYFSVGKSLNLYPSDPITVVIYTGAQYQQATSLPDWAAGSFDGKIRIREGSLAAERGELKALLWHEYTHAVLATLPVPLPAWLNEGLAKHFEGEGSAAKAALAQARGALPGWDVMQQRSFTGIADPAQARLAYAMATGLVASLVEKRGEYALQGLLSRLKQGEDLEQAFLGTYAVTPRQHFESWVRGL